MTFQSQPSTIVVTPSGRFAVPVLAVPDVATGLLRLPLLMLDQVSYLPSAVNLESEGERDQWRKRIELPDTIVLRADPTAGEGHK